MSDNNRKNSRDRGCYVNQLLQRLFIITSKIKSLKIRKWFEHLLKNYISTLSIVRTNFRVDFLTGLKQGREFIQSPVQPDQIWKIWFLLWSFSARKSLNSVPVSDSVLKCVSDVCFIFSKPSFSRTSRFLST